MNDKQKYDTGVYVAAAVAICGISIGLGMCALAVAQVVK